VLFRSAANQFLSNNPQDAPTESTDFDEVGVIPRVLNDLFRTIEDEQRADKDAKFEVKVSFVEVYNEEIKDLFNLKSAGNSEPLNIREENNQIKVVNLSEVTVNNATTTKDLLEKGSALRAVGGTAMNDQSSRSHAIFTIGLEQLNEKNNNHLIKSKFHLVDLAGSERQSKTKAEGLRLREGININLGLLALGNVISVLGDENTSGTKAKHVPYRESKLTRLLQDSLGGNSHTLMIACVSPADSNMEETLNTLRYADRARKIKNKPVVNIDPAQAELQALRQQVIDLKAQLFRITGGTMPAKEMAAVDSVSGELSALKEENERLKLETVKLIGELQRVLHVNRLTYEKMSAVEAEKEVLEKKLDEIKVLFDSMKREASAVPVLCEDLCGENSADSVPESVKSTVNKTLLDDLESKFSELREIQQASSSQKCQENAANGDELSDENQPIDKDYALRQAKMQIQLTEYDAELCKKQMLHQRMIETTSQYGMLNLNYQNCMDDLKHKVELLEKEKEDLHELLKQGESSKKAADARRDRMKQLESEVSDLKRKEKEFQKMIKLKEENEKQCEKLRQEIVNIKQERVKLIKQMRADTETFRKFRQEKEKEVNQLKALERKRLIEITKLQEGNHRQEAILRRKNEEITRIQRQLRETCEKQKQVAEKRQQAFDRKDSAMGEKIRQWITQEIEIQVGLSEAQFTKAQLLDERKELSAELAVLQQRLGDDGAESDEPPAKMRAGLDQTYVSSSNRNNGDESDESRAQLRDKIDNVKGEIECKSIQINEIQQMLLESDQDEKTKHMFNNLHGLFEAKILLKHLFPLAVQYLLDYRTKQNQYETSSNTVKRLTNEIKELRRKFEAIEAEFSKFKKTSANDLDRNTQYYEQRILCLLKTNVNDPSYTEDEKFRLLAEQVNLLEKSYDKTRTTSGNQSALNDCTNGDYKRDLKLKREMRRTRVIRTIKQEASNQCQTIDESPFASPAVPDNSEKDPDWHMTPLKSKRTRLSSKRLTRTRASKSSSSLAKTEAGLTPNDENCGNL